MAAGEVYTVLNGFIHSDTAMPSAHIIEDSAFTIHLSAQDRFVEIRMRGFWDATTMRRFDRTLRRELPWLPQRGCPIGQQVTLFDLLDFSVQNQETLAALGAMAADPSIGSRRIAVLVGSTLLKQQARRTAPGYGLFGDRESAMAWLTEAIAA